MMTMMSRRYTITGMNKIIGITPDSIAQELDILPGSVLLSVNGEKVRDIFDYRFLIADSYVELEIQSPDGEICVYEIEKDYDEEMGLEFESGIMDDYRRCSNKCIFCFIDQMPKGMRKTLYFKDDDSRLSFLQGNYVTLTNMKEADIDRIIKYHMSPINISVHSTNPKLRCMMLGNRFAGEVLRYIDKLHDSGIQMNAQIVLCKGINDSSELMRTIEDLSAYAPVMQSVSVVPSGLTKYREGLYPLQPVEPEDAREVIRIVEDFQKKIYNKHGLHFVHASDELYLMSGMEVPEESRYDGYLQLENGVGMVRLLNEEFHEALDERCSSSRKAASAKQHITIATGMLMAERISNLTGEAAQRLYDAGIVENKQKIDCIAIRNDFFGESITVSGLICGCDIISQLKGADLGEELLLPVNMMRSGEKYFLDDVTVSQVCDELGIKVTIVPSDGESLLRAILGEENEIGGRQIYEQADSSDCRTS